MLIGDIVLTNVLVHIEVLLDSLILCPACMYVHLCL